MNSSKYLSILSTSSKPQKSLIYDLLILLFAEDLKHQLWQQQINQSCVDRPVLRIRSDQPDPPDVTQQDQQGTHGSQNEAQPWSFAAKFLCEVFRSPYDGSLKGWTPIAGWFFFMGNPDLEMDDDSWYLYWNGHVHIDVILKGEIIHARFLYQSMGLSRWKWVVNMVVKHCYYDCWCVSDG